MLKNKKGPLSHQKIKCSFWITFNFWWLAKQSEQKTSTEMQNNKKGPLSHQKIKCSFIFGLCSTSDDWPSDPIDRNAKKQKRPPKSLKNQMFIFVLCSTSDDQPSDSSKKCWPNHKKILNVIKKSNVHFWITFNFWLSAQAIGAKKVDRNAKKQKRPPKSLKNQMFIFGLLSTSDDWSSDPSKKCRPKCKKTKKAP